MTELTEHEARELAGSMRPQRRPLLVALAANALLAVLLLGVPYARGRFLAQHEREDYVRFIQCMLGGKPAKVPGLSLPRGEREHYAAKVLFANTDWPMSCRPVLQRMRPPDATFLWPSLKSAGADLRVAVDLVDRELVGLAKRRAQANGRVPQRPLEAIKRLQAASTLFVRAGDVAGDIDNDSVVLSKDIAGLAAPARLPLMIGENQGLLGWSDSGVLQILAFDTHSLAYLRVDAGKVDRQRVRRNSFLRGVTRAGDTAYLVWAMPESRCAEREDRCVGRPTGLGRYDKGGRELEEPRWTLPGHPAGRLDRALMISETGRVDFLRRSSARAGVEWVRTRLPDRLSAAAESLSRKPQPLEASAVWTIVDVPQPAAPEETETADPAGPTSAATAAPQSSPSEVAQVPSSTTLVAGEPVAVLRATDSPAGIEATLTVAAQPARTITLAPATGHKPWAVSCTAGTQRFLAYGSDAELRIARVGNVGDDQSAQPLTAQPAALAAPLDPDDSGADRIRLLCEDDSAQLLFVGRDLTLREVKCDLSQCSEARELGTNVAEFAAVLRGGMGLIAYQQGPLAPTIKLLRLNERGVPVSGSKVVATCWEPLGGMCGRPILIADPQRVVLLTRDGPDMLALETINNGRTFAPLSGLTVHRTFDPSTTSPLKQHRLRKGID